MTDSGVSMDCRSDDMLDSDECSEVGYSHHKTLLDLLGITNETGNENDSEDISRLEVKVSE